MIRKIDDLNTALDFIVDVYNTTICQEDSKEGRESFIHNYVYGDDTKKDFNSGHEEYYGYYNNELQGVISLSKSGYIKFLFVKKNCHKMGIGKVLLKYVISKAYEYNIDTIALDSSLSNENFYLKMGFNKVSDKVCIDNVWFVPMEKKLISLK